MKKKRGFFRREVHRDSKGRFVFKGGIRFRAPFGSSAVYGSFYTTHFSDDEQSAVLFIDKVRSEVWARKRQRV